MSKEIDIIASAIEKELDKIKDLNNVHGFSEEMAKAAIQSIREPTQDILSAGIRKGIEIGFGCGYPDYEDIWKAMIDNILK